MALIQCPSCNEQISDQGPNCIKCGVMLKTSLPKYGYQQFIKIMSLGFLVNFIIFFIILSLKDFASYTPSWGKYIYVTILSFSSVTFAILASYFPLLGVNRQPNMNFSLLNLIEHTLKFSILAYLTFSFVDLAYGDLFYQTLRGLLKFQVVYLGIITDPKITFGLIIALLFLVMKIFAIKFIIRANGETVTLSFVRLILCDSILILGFVFLLTDSALFDFCVRFEKSFSPYAT